MDLIPNLQPGENVVDCIDNVLKFAPYSEGKQGMSGKVCLTNFKLAFVTADRSSYDLQGKRKRNKLLEEDDIPLTCIDVIYQVNPNGKRKKLIPGCKPSSRTEMLEIHCMDFKIHKFGFKFTQTGVSKKFLLSFVQHVYPEKDSMLFAHEFARKTLLSNRELVCDIPMFDNIVDWEDELQRCKCQGYWRVTDVNVSFELSQSLPQYFVVPNALTNADLRRTAPQLCQRRVPTWCYTHINGNSLTRMSAEEENMDQQQLLKRKDSRMLDAVKVAGKQRNSPKIINVAESCPSCKELQDSIAKLKKVCMSDTEREFYTQDVNWYSSLDDTKWLQHVSKCLEVSAEVTQYIVHSKRTVVIQEQSGCELSCLVCSVAQILLDPYYRTMRGFQALIQKEWVRMGHPFQKYLGFTWNKSESDTNQTPIFLLFLDCVWQLLQQFPSKFEFTETYLTTIWDTAHIGIFSTFLFNNDHHKLHYSKDEGRNIKQFSLPTAWKWDLQFQAEDLSFFRNPLHVITHDSDLSETLKQLRHLSKFGRRCQSSRNNTLSRSSAVIMQTNNAENGVDEFDVLTPKYSAPVLHLWTQCYLRWQVPAQIFCGGSPSSYLQQCHMVEEIIQLQHKIKQLQLRNTASAEFRPRSELIFGHAQKSSSLTELLNSTVLTSSFPFSPGASARDQQRFTYTPTISAFVRNSSLEFDKYMDADD
ncbi:protein-tyrosine phosphatase [Mactra antiquata]